MQMKSTLLVTALLATAGVVHAQAPPAPATPMAETAPPAPQRVHGLDTPRQRIVARKAKERVERAVGACNGLARGGKELRVEMAAVVATPEER